MNDDRKTSFEDELIDRALARRVEEPRAGFEERLLARLEDAPARRTGWLLRACAVGVPAAAVLLFALWVFRDDDHGDLPQEAPPSPTKMVETRPVEPAEPAPPRTETPPKEEPAVAAVIVEPPRPDTPVEVAHARRATTFPAPSTRSPQEELLLLFVRRAPRATLHAVATAPEEPPTIRIDELPPPRLEVEPLPVLKPLFSEG